MLTEFKPKKDLWSLLQEETRPLVVYGMGNGADKLFDRLTLIGKTPSAVFASDDFVRGQSFRGYRVQRFSDIQATYPSFVVLVSFASRLPAVMDAIYRLAEEYPVFLPDMPVAGDTYFTLDFARAHAAELKESYDLLEDTLSKEIFAAVILYKITGDIRYLKNAYSTDEEELGCLQGREIRVAIDGGAYNGDTARKLIHDHPQIERIYAVEPDPKNRKKLEKFAAECKKCKILPTHAALWKSCGEMQFNAGGNRNSSLVSASYENKGVSTKLITVDSLVANDHVDFIKYDVEGVEQEALLGSQNTVLRDRPALGVSVYHRSEDIYALPILLKNMCRNYRFYLRRTNCLPAWEMMLYAVPR